MHTTTNIASHKRISIMNFLREEWTYTDLYSLEEVKV